MWVTNTSRRRVTTGRLSRFMMKLHMFSGMTVALPTICETTAGHQSFQKMKKFQASTGTCSNCPPFEKQRGDLLQSKDI